MATAVTWNLHRAALRQVVQGRSGPVVRNLAQRARRVETVAKRLAPVDTGRLRSSIHLDGPLFNRDDVQFFIIASTQYAVFVHEGTRRMRARPFLRDAIRSAL